MSDAPKQWRNELAPTADCIALERLGAELTAREYEHLQSCARCQSEMALFRAVTNDEATADEIRDGRWIAAELHKRLDAPSLGAPSNVKAFAPRPRAPRFAFAAAAAAVLVIGTGLWIETREPSLGTPSGNPDVYRSVRVEVIAPAGDLSEAPRELRWVPVPAATLYAVKILDVDRTLLWSAETRETQIVLPATIVERFLPGKSLMWEVTARRGSALPASSGMQRFRVMVPRRNAP